MDKGIRIVAGVAFMYFGTRIFVAGYHLALS
jgi:hypothetical protein